MLSDIDPSGQEDRETWADLAHFDEYLARTIGTNRAKTAHTLDIRGLQNRKHLVTPGVDDRLRGCRHGKRLYSTPHPMGRSEPGPAGVKLTCPLCLRHDLSPISPPCPATPSRCRFQNAGVHHAQAGYPGGFESAAAPTGRTGFHFATALTQA